MAAVTLRHWYLLCNSAVNYSVAVENSVNMLTGLHACLSSVSITIACDTINRISALSRSVFVTSKI